MSHPWSSSALQGRVLGKTDDNSEKGRLDRDDDGDLLSLNGDDLEEHLDVGAISVKLLVCRGFSQRTRSRLRRSEV